MASCKKAVTLGLRNVYGLKAATLIHFTLLTLLTKGDDCKRNTFSSKTF